MNNTRIGNIVVFFIVFFLFTLPFFWFKSAELDIGGDSSRLYLYDATHYLQNSGLFTMDPEGTGKINPNQFLLPYLFFQSALNALLRSPYLIISTEKSIKLVLSFYFIYLIVRQVLEVESSKRNTIAMRFASIIAGLVYTFSSAVVDNMPYALLTHNQVFIYPMLFYLLLRYIITARFYYLLTTLSLTVLFSYCFSLAATPPPFAFFPFALLFLFLYAKIELKKTILWVHLFLGFVAFLLINSFHLVPSVLNILAPGSYLHARAIESTTASNPGLAYFNALLPMAKVSTTVMQPHVGLMGKIAALVIPFSLFIGLFTTTRKPKKHTLHLLTLFFLITLFLESANITGIGVAVYRFLFSVPGFSMFRNFFGQFQFVYAFFYALLLGFSLGVFFQRMKSKYACIFSIFLLVIIVGKSWDFVCGSIARISHRQSNDVKIAVVMDPQYEDTLSFIRSLPTDGKILTLPLSDYYMQVVYGVNNGAYMGPSSISYLTGKNDFAGYQILEPFAETFMKLSREKNFDALRRLLAILNIRYIFYNSDPNIYEKAFPRYPYEYMRTSLPKTQEEYKEYLAHVVSNILYHKGPYYIFDLGEHSYLPHIATPRYIYKEGVDMMDPAHSSNIRRVDCLTIFDPQMCENEYIDLGVSPSITITKINPAKYYVAVENLSSPTILVLSDAFDFSWQLYQRQEKRFPPPVFIKFIGTLLFHDEDIFETLPLQPILPVHHFMVNGYANGWYITPKTLHGKKFGTFIIETSVQKIFYVSLAVSLISLAVVIVFGVYVLLKYRKML